MEQGAPWDVVIIFIIFIIALILFGIFPELFKAIFALLMFLLLGWFIYKLSKFGYKDDD